MILMKSNPSPERGRDHADPHQTPAADRPHPDRELQENREIADQLDEISRLLTEQGASEFRVGAYHAAAATLRGMDRSVRDIRELEGLRGLIELPTIGRSIAQLIADYLDSGQVPLLDRLQGDQTALALFQTLPGIGPEMASRIHDQLGVETLPELMGAVASGRLGEVPGMGRKRIASIRECLVHRLRDTGPSAPPAVETVSPGDVSPDESVSVCELLDIDAQYRRLAAGGKLPKIAPRRFNPDATRWLPVLHTHRGPRHYTALYSNTARAHQLNTTRDWVVIYRDDPEAHGCWTVITSSFGRLRGWRIVRGREEECAEYYLHDRMKETDDGSRL